jgi:protein SCO1/2
MRRFLALLLPALVALACSRAPQGKRFRLTGQILAVHQERQEVLVRHEDVPGFMPAMTMPFTVRDPKLLAGRVPGDIVRAVLVVTDTASWLDELEKTGFAALPPDTSPAPPPALRPGEVVPETTLRDEQGRLRKLSEWRGRLLVATFIFTRCPLPAFCPALDKRFAELQALVKADRALAAQVQLLSVSFDPDFDQPAVLRRHARVRGADPALWLFATGEAAEIDRLGAAIGLVVERSTAEPAAITHNLRTAIIDRQGRLLEVLSGSDWEASAAFSRLKRAAEGS